MGPLRKKKQASELAIRLRDEQVRRMAEASDAVEAVAEKMEPSSAVKVYIPGISDRRTHRRYSYRSIVACTRQTEIHPGDVSFTAMTHDVSATGLSLQSMRNLSGGEQIRIQLGHPNAENSIFEVMWVLKGRADEGFRIGLNLVGKA